LYEELGQFERKGADVHFQNTWVAEVDSERGEIGHVAQAEVAKHELESGADACDRHQVGIRGHHG
jgi:hypothetical protein